MPWSQELRQLLADGREQLAQVLLLVRRQPAEYRLDGVVHPLRQLVLGSIDLRLPQVADEELDQVFLVDQARAEPAAPSG